MFYNIVLEAEISSNVKGKVFKSKLMVNNQWIDVATKQIHASEETKKYIENEIWIYKKMKRPQNVIEMICALESNTDFYLCYEIADPVPT